MELSGPFYIDGKSHQKTDLIRLSRSKARDKNRSEWERELYHFIWWFLDPARGTLRQLTSGTTGDPKSFPLSRTKMQLSAQKTIDFFGLREKDRVLFCLPVRYIAGKMMVVRALVGSLDLRIAEPLSRPVKELKKPVEFAAMVPLQVYETVLHGDDISRVKKLLIGGGNLHAETRNQLESMEVPEIYESFAMTETYTHFALRRINGKGMEKQFRVLDGVSISLDHRSCLEVYYPGITEGPVATNDLVEIGDSGDEFNWLGRIDHVINSGGVKIIPELLEQKIEKIIHLPCLLLPWPDARLGQKLVLVVESSSAELKKEQILESLRKELHAYEVPKQIVQFSTIPRNASFKPDRREALKVLKAINSI